MMGRKPKNKMSKGATLIAENTRIEGNVRFSDQLYVNGHIEGDVHAEDGSEATLVISDVGSVKGEIDAPTVVVNGKVEGNVRASGRVQLAANAHVSGNVYYKLIEMALGARVEGQLVHEQDSATRSNVHPLGRIPDDHALQPAR